MNVEFFLEALGWLVCLITDEDGHETKISHSSDYGDKFQELINKLLLMKEIIDHERSEYLPYEFNVVWCDDISNYKIEFNLEKFISPVEITITETALQNSDFLQVLFRGKISSHDLFDQLLDSLESMLRDFGLLGFKRNWEAGNFPVADYLILKSVKYHYELSCSDEWEAKVALEEEVALLMKK